MQNLRATASGSYTFVLKPVSKSCKIQLIKVDFEAVPTHASLERSQTAPLHSHVPAYHRDSKHYLPSFIVPQDKEYYKVQEALELEKFQARVVKADELCRDEPAGDRPPEDVSTPEPINNYCQICKGSFASYWDHLKETSHLRQMHFSKANKYISQLSRKYQLKKDRPAQERKTKPIKKKPGTQNAEHGRAAPETGNPAPERLMAASKLNVNTQLGNTGASSCC